MARVNKGSHSFTCHPHVYSLVEWTISAFNPPAAQRHRTLAGIHFRPTLRVGGWVYLWWLGEILRWFARPKKVKIIFVVNLSILYRLSSFFHYYNQLKPNPITLSSSLAGRRPVRDQIPLHYPPCDQHASRSATSSRAGSRAASELGEDLRVHVVRVSQAKFHYAVQLARELVAEQGSVMEYGLNRLRPGSCYLDMSR